MKQILLTILLGMLLMMPKLNAYAGEKDDAHIAYIGEIVDAYLITE